MSKNRIENRSLFLPIHFRQVEGSNDSWQILLPNSSESFMWEDTGRSRLLEVLVHGAELSNSQKFNIDEISDHQPIHVASGLSRALCVSIVKEEKINVVKISDWMPESEPIRTLSKTDISPLSQLTSAGTEQNQQQSLSTDSEFHLIVELAEFGVSIVDHTPEEILYLSIQNLFLSYSTGLGSGFSR